MSKKMKILIGILIVLAVIGLIFGVITITRFIVLENILSDVQKNIEKENYNMKTMITNNGVVTTTYSYYRDGIGKFVYNNGIYIWYDGELALQVSEKVNEAILLSTIDGPIAVVGKESFATLYPGYSSNFFGRLMFAGDISNKIESELHNGKKCTVITIQEELCTKKYWIEKKSNKLIKAEAAFTNGDLYSYTYEINFNTTGIGDVELPDLSNYTIVDGKTNEEIDLKDTNQNNNIEPKEIVIENVVNNVEVPNNG